MPLKFDGTSWHSSAREKKRGKNNIGVTKLFIDNNLFNTSSTQTIIIPMFQCQKKTEKKIDDIWWCHFMICSVNMRRNESHILLTFFFYYYYDYLCENVMIWVSFMSPTVVECQLSAGEFYIFVCLTNYYFSYFHRL